MERIRIFFEYNFKAKSNFNNRANMIERNNFTGILRDYSLTFFKSDITDSVVVMDTEPY